MTEPERFAMLLVRTGVGLPRGVLGEAARTLARAVADGAPQNRARLRTAAAREHWGQLRGAIGASLERAGDPANDPTLADALALVVDEDPANPLALALVDDAARLLAAVIVRTRERLAVLDRRLAGDGGGDEVSRTVGDIVIDLLDLDPQDFEDEIADYLRAGDSDASRAQLARATGDPEIRAWAREELAWVSADGEGAAARALARLAAVTVPEDPADDAVWLATATALVEEAVELATVDQVTATDEHDLRDEPA